MVFCIHGNKYGVVKCCDSLNEEAGASNQDNAKLTGTLNEVSDEDDPTTRVIKYHLGPDFLKLRTVGLTLEFGIGEKPV